MTGNSKLSVRRASVDPPISRRLCKNPSWKAIASLFSVDERPPGTAHQGLLLTSGREVAARRLERPGPLGQWVEKLPAAHGHALDSTGAAFDNLLSLGTRALGAVRVRIVTDHQVKKLSANFANLSWVEYPSISVPSSA